jgi:hypothetical protein
MFVYPAEAIAREKEIKGWSRSKEIALIEGMNPHWRDLAAEGQDVFKPVNRVPADPPGKSRADGQRRGIDALSLKRTSIHRPYALTTLPLRRQDVQTRMRLVAAPTLAWTGRRLTFQRRLVTLWAWLILFPNCGPLPQRSQTCAMKLLQVRSELAV